MLEFKYQTPITEPLNTKMVTMTKEEFLSNDKNKEHPITLSKLFLTKLSLSKDSLERDMHEEKVTFVFENTDLLIILTVLAPP